MFAKLFTVAALAGASSVPAFADPTPPAHEHHHGVIVMDGQVTRYEDMTPEQRAKLDAKMKELSVKMARLSERLKVEGAERDLRIKAAMERAHDAMEHARAAQLSPERIRMITERAERQADASRRAAEAAERAVEAIKPRLEAMSREIERAAR